MNNSLFHGLQVAGVGIGITALTAAGAAVTNYHPTDPQQALILAAAAPIATGLIQGLLHYLKNKQAQG